MAKTKPAFPEGMTGGDAIRFLNGVNEAAWSAHASLKLVIDSGALTHENEEVRKHAVKVLTEAYAKLSLFYGG